MTLFLSRPILHMLFIAGIASAVLGECPADQHKTVEDLTVLSLEDLMEVEVIQVTSVAKKKQKLVDAAAAVFVLTQEDIQRSGITHIVEAFRLVPGLEVARLNSSAWAISARGFNGRQANKLLVLIDGRTVYSPLFSLVLWDIQDLVLEDIERIEVVRGPGATLWGANAVNGVINIMTKNAKDTQGVLLNINRTAAERSALKISSKLLKLAKKVY